MTSAARSLVLSEAYDISLALVLSAYKAVLCLLVFKSQLLVGFRCVVFLVLLSCSAMLEHALGTVYLSHNLSVCPSITSWYCGIVSKLHDPRIMQIASRCLCHHAVSVRHTHMHTDTSGSHAILVFPHQIGWQYSDGNPPNGGVECSGVG